MGCECAPWDESWVRDTQRVGRVRRCRLAKRAEHDIETLRGSGVRVQPWGSPMLGNIQTHGSWCPPNTISGLLFFFFYAAGVIFHELSRDIVMMVTLWTTPCLSHCLISGGWKGDWVCDKLVILPPRYFAQYLHQLGQVCRDTSSSWENEVFERNRGK